MKIATTIAEVLGHVNYDPVAATRFYRGTGFRHLDYSFYSVLTIPKHPFMGENWKDAVFAAKAAAEEEGFTWVQAHLPACKMISEGREDGLKACLRAIEACGILGISIAVIHSSLSEGNYRYPTDRDAYFAANKPFFDALIPAMEQNGVSVLLENSCEVNTRGTYFPMTARDLNEFIAYLDHPLFGACWDIGHAHIQGLDQHDELIALGKNLKAVHIHDNDGTKDQHRMPFDGTLDFDSFLRGIRDSGFQGPFTFEVDGYLKARKDLPPESKNRIPLAIKHNAIESLYKCGTMLLSAYGIDGE